MPTAQYEHRERPPLYGVRVNSGLSQREAARRAGIDPGHMSKFERGEAGLSIDNLVRLARVLGAKELVRLLQPYARS